MNTPKPLRDWRDSTITRGRDNQTCTDENAYRPLPLSETHTPTWQRRDFPLFSPEDALLVIRGLVAVIEQHELQGIDHMVYEMAKEILARE